MKSFWSYFSSGSSNNDNENNPKPTEEPKQKEIENNVKEPEKEVDLEGLSPIDQLFTTVNEIYRLVAEDKYEVAILNHKKYLTIKKDLQTNNIIQTINDEQLNMAQQMYEKALEKFATVVRSKVIESIEKNLFDEQIRFCCIYSLLGNKDESIKIIFNHYIKPNLLKITNKLKRDLLTVEKNDTIYSGGLTSLFEHIADVLDGLKDIILLNFGLESYYYIIDNTQKESDQICEEILQKFLESKVRKQAEEIIKNRDVKFDVLEIKGTVDEITSMSMKCEIYCTFLINTVDSSYLLAEKNQLELLSTHSSDYLLSLESNKTNNNNNISINLNNSGSNINNSFNNSPTKNQLNTSVNEDDEFLSDKMNRLEMEKKRPFENYSKEQVQQIQLLKVNLCRDIQNSKLKRSIQEAMTYYFQLEKFYMEKMIKNSLQPVKSENQNHFIDIDGFFFVLSSCSCRAISASNCNIASSIINLVYTHLEFELMDSISHLSEGEEYTDEEICQVVNEIHLCSENISKLKCILEQESKKFFSKNPKEIEKINSCLASFTNIAKKLKSLVEEHYRKFGFIEFAETKQLLDAFPQLSYVLNDEQFVYLQVNDRFFGKLILSVKKHLSFFSKLLSENNFEDLKQLIFKNIVSSLESSIFSIRFNHTGALQLEKEIKRLQQSFTTFSTKSVRVLFSKLIQMCSNVLTIENPNDILDLWSDGQGWLLNKAEVRKLLALRIESQFHPQAIANIKL